MENIEAVVERKIKFTFSKIIIWIINFNLAIIVSRMRNATSSRTFSSVPGVEASQHDDYSIRDFRKQGRTSNDLSNRRGQARFLDNHRLTDKLQSRRKDSLECLKR